MSSSPFSANARWSASTVGRSSGRRKSIPVTLAPAAGERRLMTMFMAVPGERSDRSHAAPGFDQVEEIPGQYRARAYFDGSVAKGVRKSTHLQNGIASTKGQHLRDRRAHLHRAELFDGAHDVDAEMGLVHGVERAAAASDRFVQSAKERGRNGDVGDDGCDSADTKDVAQLVDVLTTRAAGQVEQVGDSRIRLRLLQPDQFADRELFRAVVAHHTEELVDAAAIIVQAYEGSLSLFPCEDVACHQLPDGRSDCRDSDAVPGGKLRLDR